MKHTFAFVTLVLTLFFIAFTLANGAINNMVDNQSPESLLIEMPNLSDDEEPITQNGLNRKILRKDAGFTFSNQVTEPNTIYEIRSEFDLNNKTITVPENCTFLFAGGRLKNGTIVGNNTYLEGRAELVLGESLTFSDMNKFHVERVSFPKGKDISELAQKMLDVFNVLKLEVGTYYISKPLVIRNHYAVIKGTGHGTIITSDNRIDYAIRTVFNSEVKKPGEYYNASIINISDIKIDGGRTKKIKNGIYLDGPSCTVSNCHVTNIESVGVRLGKWCNLLTNCIITHCDIGALISEHANAVNVCYNRIESNTVNLVVHGFRGVNICNNTLEGAATFNIAVGSGISCKIRDNYFEGETNSITNLLKTMEDRFLEFSGTKKLKGCLWIGAIDLSEKDYKTNITYRIGSKNAPSSVLVENNYIDMPSEKVLKLAASEAYFVLIGSCSVNLAVNNNSIVRPQKAVCGFFDTDNAILENTEILNNYVAHTSKTNNSLELIHDKYSKEGWRAKQHVIGKLLLDSN